MDELLTRIVHRMTEGIYEHGEYAKCYDLETGPVTEAGDGSISFEVATTTPDTDREIVTVTLRRGRS